MDQRTEESALEPLHPLTDDGQTIEGRWEIAHDGSTWEHDFDLTYRKVA